MKILHILKSRPDPGIDKLKDILSEGEEVSVFPLYEEPIDYKKLIDMIFEHHKVISWW